MAQDDLLTQAHEQANRLADSLAADAGDRRMAKLDASTRRDAERLLADAIGAAQRVRDQLAAELNPSNENEINNGNRT